MAGTTVYAALVERGRQKWGDRFDASALDPRFVRWYDSGERVKVRHDYDDGTTTDTTGTIGATTGWRPAFLLVLRANAHSSSYVIGARDHVVAVKRGGKYVPVEDDESLIKQPGHTLDGKDIYLGAGGMILRPCSCRGVHARPDPGRLPYDPDDDSTKTPERGYR